MTAAVEPLTSVMRSLPGQANGYLTWRLQMNRKIDPKALQAWVSTKTVATIGVDVDRTVHPPRILRKTYWDEDEHQRWKLSRSSARPRAGGRLRRFPRRVLLQVLFSILQAKSELTRSELLRLFQDDLVSNRVLAKGAERPALSRFPLLSCYLSPSFAPSSMFKSRP